MNTKLNWFQSIVKKAQSQVTLDTQSLEKVRANVSQYWTDLMDWVRDNPDPDTDTLPYGPKEVQDSTNLTMQQTEQNMQKIVMLIQNSISNISTWNGSTVIVRAGSPSYDWSNKANWGDPITDAFVQVGEQQAWGGAPEFTLFFNPETGDVEIDDILEAGDEDFFVNDTGQSDYFSLIREIKHPGASQSTKFVTLYTARPTKDRSIYQNANQVPSGIFLTNSYHRVQGMASDLSDGGMRDIWQIRIEEKYLTQTLDSPSVKDYQITGGGMVPVARMKLIDEGY